MTMKINQPMLKEKEYHYLHAWQRFYARQRTERPNLTKSYLNKWLGEGFDPNRAALLDGYAKALYHETVREA